MRHFILLLCFIFILPLHAQRSDFNEIDFWRADYIAEQYEGEDLYNMPTLVYGLTSQLNTEVEQFRAIYYWVCYNIRGDYYLMSQNDRYYSKFKNDPVALQQWNRQFKKEVFKRLLKDQETLCTGYAFLIKELANLAGLECEIIYGYGPANKIKVNKGEAPNHSWNAIKLDGKWYLCDATWSSGFINMSTFLFEFNYEDSYFLMAPEEFLKSHEPVNKKWRLLPPASK